MTLFFGTVSFGQSASLENKTAFPNTTTDVALNVGDFTNVTSITFLIRYNPEVVAFTGITNPALSGLTAYAADSTITVFWSSPTAQSVSGILCKLNFMYYGTTSTLGFLPASTVTTGTLTPVNILVGYTNGSVSQASCVSADLGASIGSATKAPGQYVDIPVTFAPNSYTTLISAVTQVISYDANKLSFAYVTGTGAFVSGVNVSASNGIITITWTNTTGLAINSSSFILHFMYNGPGTASIAFAPGCVVTTAYSASPSLSNVNVCYSNGSVSQTATSNTAILGSLSSVVQGDDILVPLDLNITGPVSAFTVYMYFDFPVLAFTGVSIAPALAPFVNVNATGTLITIAYSNPSPAPITPGTFLNLKFHYTGMGTGYVNFSGNCEFMDDMINPINVMYTNGTVAPGILPANAHATIGSVTGSAGSEITVPIAIEGSTSNPIGAVTMFISYDNEKLSFTGVTGNTYNATYGTSGTQVSIAWNASTSAGVNLTGTFINLTFQYNGGGGGVCSSDIYFKNDDATGQPCELANKNAAFVPAHWINGGVNLFPATPAIAGEANPVAGSVKNYSTDLAMINYMWNVSGGTITSNLGDHIVVHWGAIGAASVNVSYTNPGGCNLNNSKSVTIIGPGSPTTTITGRVAYDNDVISQYMDGVNISLYNSASTLFGSTTTATVLGNKGTFTFTSAPQDDYTIVATLSAPWGGVTGLDALLVELNTAGVLTPPLSGIRYVAGNVNSVLPVNASDALLIKERLAAIISTFPAGDWVFDTGIVHNFPGPTTYNFTGLCTGDVNGSYSPVVGVKDAPSLAPVENEIMTIPVDKSFTYNLKSSRAAQLGAMTLYLGYDPELFEVVKMNSSLDGMVYSIKNGKISVVWSNLNSRQLQDDEAILSLQVKTRKTILTPTRIFTVLRGLEFVDPALNILSDLTLKLAKVVTNSPSSEFSLTNYPNPFTNSTTIAYEMPAAGQVRLTLSDLLGKQIAILKNTTEEAGLHSFNLNPASYNLTSGIYLYKIEIITGTENFSKIQKMVYTQ
ncbi:MAG: cohesin domain-containing protein [Bacteroidota bacterium]